MPRLTRRPPRPRALVASARTLQVGNEKDALAIRRTRQPWQPQAWAYRDAIGEIGYAMRFLANANSRMRLYAAAYDPDDPNANPVPVDEAPGIPKNVAALAGEALNELGAGQLALSGLIKPLTENLEVPGEGYLVSDPAVITDQLWSIRSMDEIQVREDGTYLLRDEPESKATVQPQGRPLSKDAYVARMWTPHPRFHNWADSPMRQLIDTCDELLLLSRSIRGVARSRLAGSGILAVAEEFSIQRQGEQETDDDPAADPFMDELTQSIMTAIRDEASAAGVVPVLLRGPAALIKDGIQFIPFDRKMDDKAVALRGELIGRIATGIDLPKEVITGTADLNHWSAFQVDDNTFRHHIEPKVLTMVDCLTVAFLRPWLLTAGVPPDLADRLVVWYDPTELVTHPDRTKDALDVFDRFGISLETLREVAGWNDDNKPADDEMLLRLLFHSRTFAPNLQEALFHKFAPGMLIPADANEPGYGPDGEPLPPDSQQQPPPPPATDPEAPVTGPPQQPNGRAPAPTGGQSPRMQALTAAGKPNMRLSRRLANIDRSLRDRLVAAADAAVRRALERAGNKARAKAPNAVKTALSGVPSGAIPAALGPEKIRDFGLDDDALLDDQFDQLRQSWDAWVDSANRQALTVIVTLTGLAVDDPRLARARQRQEQQQSAGWAFLAAALRARAHQLLYNPDPNQPDQVPHDTEHTVVAVGTVRAAIAVAAGAGTGLTDPGVTPHGRLADGSAQPVPGVTSGPIASDLAASGGASIAGYIWNHGATEHPFLEHLDLDQTPFTDWNSDDLQPGDDAGWMGVGNYFPGDHDGCSCDVTIEWTEPAAEGAAVASGALNGRHR